MRKLYLDIDGVLLTTRHSRVAQYAIELICYVTQHFDCYWLTTHCKGDVTNALHYLSFYFEQDCMKYLKMIKPTSWDSLKTEAIDFGSDFYWLEDNPLQVEKRVLEQHGKLERLIEVNLENTCELENIMKRLKKLPYDRPIKIAQPLAFSLKGKRERNEDCIYPQVQIATNEDTLFMVCDGVGGLAKGEIASKTVCQTISNYLLNYNDIPFTTTLFNNALSCAWDELDRIAKYDTGTTLTFLKILDESVFIAHIGDSRVYHVRPCEEAILFQTKDHSMANLLVERGEIQENDLRLPQLSHIMTKAIQANQPERDKADIYQTSNIQSGDYFFLCSDGVSESLNDSNLIDILCSPVDDNYKMKLIERVCAEKSTDNYSAYLIKIL